jgi:hypothetical protein
MIKIPFAVLSFLPLINNVKKTIFNSKQGMLNAVTRDLFCDSNSMNSLKLNRLNFQ